MFHAVTLTLALTLGAEITATDTLKERDAEIRRALPPGEQPLSSGEKSKLEDLLTKAVDLPTLAQDSLGKRWEKLSAADRKRYVKAFSARFRKASDGEIDFYRNTEIGYGQETTTGDDVHVPTTLTLKGEPTPVVYTLRRIGLGFRIVDLSVDGVSTVENYRSSFGKVLDKEGVDGLVARLGKDPVKVGAK